MKFFKKKKSAVWIDVVILVAILGLALALRLWLIGKEALWLDEAYSLKYSEGGLVDIVRAVIENKDPHPAFYYFLLYFWRGLFGSGEVVLRGFSILFGILAVGGGYFLGRKIKDRWLGILISLMIAVLYFPIFYSLEIRMYSLVLALMVMSLYFVFALIEKVNLWRMIGFVIVSVLLLYTHYFSVFWVGFLFLYWLTQKPKVKCWLSSAGIVLLGFLPWLWVFFQQIGATVSGGEENLVAWLTLPDPPYDIFRIIFERFLNFSVGFGSYSTFLILFGLVILIFAKFKKFGKGFAWFFVLGYAFNLIIPYVFSVYFEPIIHPRYMQGAFLLSVLLVGMLIWSSKNRIFYVLSGILILVFSFVTFNQAQEKYFHPDWNGVFENYELEGKEILVLPEYYAMPLEYHLEQKGIEAEVGIYEEQEGEFIFIERKSMPEIVERFRNECEILEEQHFERIGVYEIGCWKKILEESS